MVQDDLRDPINELTDIEKNCIPYPLQHPFEDLKNNMPLKGKLNHSIFYGVVILIRVYEMAMISQKKRIHNWTAHI